VWVDNWQRRSSRSSTQGQEPARNSGGGLEQASRKDILQTHEVQPDIPSCASNALGARSTGGVAIMSLGTGICTLTPCLCA